MFLVVVNVLLLIAGMFMEPTGIILIMAPILFPIATQLGIDPVHLGIIMVVNLEIRHGDAAHRSEPVCNGRNHPNVDPAGARAALPWTLVLLLFLGIVTYVPAITMFLPNLLF